MRFTRPAAVALLALLLASGAGAATRAQSTSLPAPTSLHGFMLRSNEPAQDTFTRTPSFAWNPVSGVNRYEFQLATSRTFASGALLARKTTRSPAASLAISLPWITGTPYSLYARVRGLAPNGATTPWSTLFGFNMRWLTLPTPLPAAPGLVRWTPVDGASAYQVWYIEPKTVFKTQTTVADEREYYTLHQDAQWTDTVHWRVRAVRTLYGAAPNGLPAVSYGPWSPVYTATNTPFASGPLADVESLSDTVSTAATPEAHHLMPAFVFNGNTGLDGVDTQLYRVYVTTDRDCVNVVFRGAIVGSPAYAPRWNGTLDLPKTVKELADRERYLGPGDEGTTMMADRTSVTANEAEAPGDPIISSGEDDSPSNGDTDVPPVDTKTTPLPQKFEPATLKVDESNVGPPVDLWDTDWPTGRYYWTVVPVGIFVKTTLSARLSATAQAGATTITMAEAGQLSKGDSLLIGEGTEEDAVTVVSTSGTSVTISPALVRTHLAGTTVDRAGDELMYKDLDLPQDACAAGRVLTFGKTGEPALASNSNLPFASGMSPSGRLMSATNAKPTFYGNPLVSWQPALGASAYEVQWSKTRYPFVTVTTPILTFGTSAVLPLTPGKWWYRVRGVNLALPAGARAMAWSNALPVVVAKPTFRVVGGNSSSNSAPKAKAHVSSTMHVYDRGDFTIAVPKTWRTVKPGDTLYRFIALDTKLRGSFHAVVNVLTASGRGTRTPAQWAAALAAQVKHVATGSVSVRLMREPAGLAVHLSYRTRTAKAASISQYVFDAGARAYIVTFGSSPSASAYYARVFARSAASFSF